MTIDFYQYHSNPEQLIYYDKAYECVPRLVWDKYRNQPEELKKREDIIAKDPQTAIIYAEYILKDIFPKGEEAIAKDPLIACGYAINILKGPFLKGEDAIAKDPYTAYRYAKYVLKGRFEKGGVTLLNSIFADDYKQFLNTTP